MRFDLARSLRALKPQKQTALLRRRSDTELQWASDLAPAGSPLLFDTMVYIDVLQGRTPREVDELIASRICYHSAVCLSELTHAFGRLKPDHVATKGALQRLQAVVDAIPAHRLHTPSERHWGEAGMLAGTLFRLSGLPAGVGHERRLLNDALLASQARSLGVGVLTGNVGDFDFLDQLIGDLGLALYRSGRSAAPAG